MFEDTKTDFDFESVIDERPLDKPTMAEFNRKQNELGAIDFEKIRSGEGSEVNFEHIVAVEITAADIKADTITANEIAAGTITANEIASDTITANQIAANTITSSEINTGAINIGSWSGNLDDVSDGSTYKKSTANQNTGGDRAYSGLDSSYKINKGFTNSDLSSESSPYNGVRIDSNGIYGYNSGSATFYISSAGSAYFSGSVEASTITGSDIETSSTYPKVSLQASAGSEQNSLSFYDSGGTVVGRVTRDGSSMKLYSFSNMAIQSAVVPTVDGGFSLGADRSSYRWGNAFISNTIYAGQYYEMAGWAVLDSNRELMNIASVGTDLIPSSDVSYDLGSASYQWSNGYIDTLACSGVLAQLIDTDDLYDYSGSYRQFDLSSSYGPQAKNPLGLNKLSGTPGSASNYEGYMYYDTSKANVVFSDGSGWYEVQASAY